MLYSDCILYALFSFFYSSSSRVLCTASLPPAQPPSPAVPSPTRLHPWAILGWGGPTGAGPTPKALPSQVPHTSRLYTLAASP